MPPKRRLPKKKLSYWIQKWLRKVRIGLNPQNHRFQKPPHDIIFLISEEVKASLAKASNPDSDVHTVDSSPRPDPGILPQKNRLSGRRRKPKSLSEKLRLFMHEISLGILKKKHSTSRHHRNKQTKSTDDASIADKFQKLSKLKTINEIQGLEEPVPGLILRHHQHKKHRHRNWFRKTISHLKRNVKFLRKKSDLNRSFALDTPEDSAAKHHIKVPWTNYIKPTLTSTAMFIVAYQLSWFFYQLAVMIMASFFNINSVLFYYEVMFPEGSNSVKWTPETIIIITLAGPFFALIGWIALGYILRLKDRYGAHFRMFLVWMYLISMMLFFGAFVGGAITLEGFGYVIDWLFMSVALRLILSVLFITMIIAISWKVVRFMPETARSYSWKNNRYKYILSRLIIPWFLGAGIMTLLKITKNTTQHANIFDYDLINLATLAFAVVPPLFNSHTRPQMIRHRKVNQRLKANLPVIWIASAIIIAIIFRFVLSHGVYFRFILRLNLNFYN